MMTADVLSGATHRDDHEHHDPAELVLVSEARPCVLPPNPEQRWERSAQAGARILAGFLTLALALFVASIVVAVQARASQRYAPPPVLEQVRQVRP